jgi:hypothetical protein
MGRRALDLTGQRFGRLVAVEWAENHKRGDVQWLCRCDCGAESVTLTRNLLRGATRSCGCLKADDLTGQRFGPLVVSERTENSAAGDVRWLCRCGCGPEKIVKALDLRRGSTRSCGCLHHEVIDLTGQRFGRLVAIERAENHKRGDVQWRCRCDCGDESIVLTRNLQRGATRSCGCLRREFNAARGAVDRNIVEAPAEAAG